MVEPPIPLTTLSEDQRAQAHTRFTIIRPTLEDGVTQAQVARTHDISKSTIGRWVKHYRENGLAGLADAQVRSDKGMPRRLSAEAVTLIEGLALQTPPRTIAAIHRQVCTLAQARGWNVPSYDSVLVYPKAGKDGANEMISTGRRQYLSPHIGANLMGRVHRHVCPFCMRQSCRDASTVQPFPLNSPVREASSLLSGS